MENEIWVPVKCASKYMVSNLSRIKSVERVDDYKRHHKEKFLTKSKGNPYDMITIYDDQGNKKPYSVYTVVFWSFNPDLQKIPGYQVDHADQNPLNDNLSNLSYVISRHNSINRSLNKVKTSRFTGVSLNKSKSKWYAHIRVKETFDSKSKSIYLGSFDEEEKAAEAYSKALKAVNGLYFTKELIESLRQ